MSSRNLFLALALLGTHLLLISCGKAPAFNRAAQASEGVFRGTLGVEEGGLVFTASGFTAQIHWAHGPVVDELCSFVLTFKGPQGVLADPPHELVIEPWMPDMGHGTSPVEIQRLSEGIWAVREVYFSMPGFWVVPIHLRRQDGSLADSAKFEVNL